MRIKLICIIRALCTIVLVPVPTSLQVSETSTRRAATAEVWWRDGGVGRATGAQ